MALAPRRVVDGALWLAYADAARIVPRSWVFPATRALGLVYVLVAVRGRTDGSALADPDAG
jgi:hypothetical protein